MEVTITNEISGQHGVAPAVWLVQSFLNWQSNTTVRLT